MVKIEAAYVGLLVRREVAVEVVLRYVQEAMH